jgi:hypothetical protein
MADRKTKRIRPLLLNQDTEAHNALKTITGYAPANKDFTIARLDAAKTEMDQAKAAEDSANAAALAARDNAVAKEWAYHDKILGAKRQVIAQYGDNSDELQAIGLKKKSERKSPARKATK